MLPVVWRDSAAADLDEIVDYVGEFDPAAAERLWRDLRTIVEPLSEHPYLYPPSQRAPGFRELVATRSYVILYRVCETAVEIVAVVHARRQFPPV